MHTTGILRWLAASLWSIYITPQLNDDEYRRGRKTTHVVYGEDMGILAGDALLNYAFETAARAFAMDGASGVGAVMSTLRPAAVTAFAAAGPNVAI